MEYMSYQDLKQVFADAQKRFESKNKLFADQWKTMTIEELQELLYNKEIMEKASQKEKSERYKQLMDIINTAAMLAARIKGV